MEALALMILGLDPSLTAFGWFLGEFNSEWRLARVDSGCIETKPSKDRRVLAADDITRRVREICEELLGKLKEHTVSVILTEAAEEFLREKTGQKGAIRYGIAHGIPGSLASIIGVPIYTVKAVSARKAILGKPNGWTKPKIEKAVMPLIEGFKQETSQNRRWGVSDAALCALYSQHHPVASAILEVSHGRKPGSSARSLRHQQCLFGG
ncbi:MAG: hypothetical protein DWQ01_08510 [Planctomycetota bacterium]|nr:MAG: hypothetical protein DWQ01_08510 [Planctomycetota bacterium]